MRETECFSMYSDMSRRIMDFSSSNKNSASARASSVFPTPVGPRKINDPIGRLGSESPARFRRMEFATRSSAESCPITRLRRRDSMVTSFCASPSSNRPTGIPVHLLTSLAMSSSSTSSFSMPPFFCTSSRFFCAAAISRSAVASLP